MSLSSFAVNAPVKVAMIFLAVLLLGYISLTRLPTNLFPDIRAPRVTMTVRTRGLSSLEVERRICEPLERSLYTLRGVTDVRTIARADSAVVVTEFSWDTPLDFAFFDVKQVAADIQRDRGADIESVSVLRYDPNAVPVITMAVRGRDDADPEELRKLAVNFLKPRFERLPGVANVVIAGGEEREVRVALDETLMMKYGLEVGNITGALQSDNVNSTGGYVEEGARRYLLKAVGEYRELGQIESVVVGRQGDSPVLLKDVAVVELVPREAKSLVLLDGKNALSMAFYREAETNTVAVAKGIRKEMDGLKEALPTGVELVVANDQSIFITSALQEVKGNAVLGGVLAILVLLFFLRDFRTTLVIAVAIPISIVTTFNIMYFQGLSLNLMSLGGLALGTGMLVDNAIVVLENIFRLRKEGKSARESARLGTQQVSAAIIASTLTTIVVFFPVIYIKGVAAMLFREQALTVTYSLLASLVVALLLIPMLSARFLGEPPKSMMDDNGDEVPRNPYVKMLSACLRFRGLVLISGVLTLAASVLLGAAIPREFLPRTEVRQIGLRITAPSGTPIEATRDIARSVLDAADQYRPALVRSYARIGEFEGTVNANTEDPDGPNTADLYLTLYGKDEATTEVLQSAVAKINSTTIVEEMKPALDRFEGVKAEFRLDQGSVLELIGSSGAPLVIEISGEEIETLSAIAAQLQERLTAVPGLLNVRTNILEGSPEVRIQLDRVQLARLGLDVASVGNTLRQRIEGDVATQIKRETGDVDIRVKVDYGPEGLEMLKRITLRNATGAMVPLESVATFEVVRGPREIVRRRQERIAMVYADLDNIRLSDAITRVEAAITDLPVPRGYFLKFTGEEERRAEAFGSLTFALILSMAMVYMVMASVFESFLQPLLIMFTIPLAGIGVVAAFLATSQSLNVMALIGIVMLGGIVVNNAIVLLDCVNQVRSDNGALSDRDTLLIGCSRRLRPVFMTTATTLLGLVPLAMGLGEGAEMQQAMAIAVIGGLLSSTILTLFIIPVCQSYLDSSRAVLRGLWRRRSAATLPAQNPRPSEPAS